MSNITSPSSPMRIDLSRVNEYTGINPPKLSFGKKVLQFAGKALGVLGPVGAAVMAATGVGLGPALAVYAGSNFAGSLAARSESNAAAAASQQSRMPVTVPGFSEQPNTVATEPNFIIPSDMEKPVVNVVENSEIARGQAVEGFQFY